MKGLGTLFGPFVLIAVLAISVFAWGLDWEIDNPMLGGWRGGPGDGETYGNLLPDRSLQSDAFKPQSLKESVGSNLDARTSPSEFGLRPSHHPILDSRARDFHEGAAEPEVKLDAKENDVGRQRKLSSPEKPTLDGYQVSKFPRS